MLTELEKLHFKNEISHKEILENLPGHIYWCNSDGIILGCNTQQAFSFNTTVENMQGKHIRDFILNEKELNQTLANNEKVIRTKQPLTVEEEIHYPDGKHSITLSHKIPLINKDNEIIGILGISFDFTESSKQKTHAQTLLDTVIRLVHINIFWKDKNGYYLGCNDKQAEFFGLKSRYDIEKKTSYDLWEIIEPNNPNNAKNAAQIDLIDQEIIDSNKAKHIEEKYITKDNQIKYFHSQKLPLTDKNNNVIGLLGLSIDITEQKKAEEIRLQNIVIEEKLKIAKIQAASIAHEIRTPLGAVTFIGSVAEGLLPEVMRGYQLAVDVGLIEKKVQDDDLKALSEIPHDLQHIAAGANTFIDMLLMKVNLENKNARVGELKEFMIGQIISEAIKMYPVNTSFSHEDIHFDGVNDFLVKAEPLFIRHIIFNLLKNAIHYVLRVGKGKIDIWMEHGEEFNTLHFNDTGSGMSPETLQQVFAPFFSNTRHGTGVGLALCKMFMEEFGGKITCDSLEGEYTHFRMQFPKV